MFKRSSSPKTNNIRVCDKIESLRKIGVKISVIDKNEKYKDGYTLGSMKDDHPNSRIVALCK